MNKINIDDTKKFMNKLLKNEDFDEFLLKEATITTFNTFFIDGRIKEAFYNKEYFDTLPDKNFSCWSDIKSHCFNIIKGKTLPINFKIVLKLNETVTRELLTASGAHTDYSDIEGLYLNIRYENNTLYCISSTSLLTFTIDKSLENHFDKEIERFLLAL